MNWVVNIAGRARRALKRFAVKDRNRILDVLSELAMNPYHGDIEKISGELNTWRRRVGNYRILYDINVNEKLIEVRIIKRRSSNTY